jgi:putative transposase
MGLAKHRSTSGKQNIAACSASDLKRLKELEEENRRLKQMYANLSLEHAVLKDIIEKNSKIRRAA